MQVDEKEESGSKRQLATGFEFTMRRQSHRRLNDPRISELLTFSTHHLACRA